MLDDADSVAPPAIIFSGGSETVTSALVDEFAHYSIPFRIVHQGAKGLFKGLVPDDCYREMRWPPTRFDESVAELRGILGEFRAEAGDLGPIFPTEDGGLRFLLQACPQLPHYVSMSRANALSWGGLDKAELFEYLSMSPAASLCAETMTIVRIDQIEQAVSELGGDCIAKPSLKPCSMDLGGMRGKTVGLRQVGGAVEGRDDLAASWSVAERWVVQQRLRAVDGHGEVVWYGCHSRTRGIVASCTAIEKWKQPRSGGTACWVTLDGHWKSELDRMAASILGVLEFDGLVEMAYLQDRRGELRLLELNPRPWLQVGLPGRCGLPLAVASYRCLSGRGEELAQTVSMGSWVSPERLLLSALSGEHGYRLPALFRAMTLIVRADVRAVWDSPLPGLRSRWLRRHARKLKPRFLSV